MISSPSGEGRIDARRLAAVAARPCLQALAGLARERGERLWLAGGALRDLLLGRGDDLRSWDLVVEGSALALAADAAGRWGLHRNMLHRPWALVELLWPDEAPLRLAELSAPSIEEDLLGRDFTANAMAIALDGERDGGRLPRLVDPREGLADLAAGRLVAANWEVFGAEPLRAIRALVLSRRLGLELPAMALARARRAAPSMAGIDGEAFWRAFWPLLEEDELRVWDEVAELGLVEGFLRRLEGEGIAPDDDDGEVPPSRIMERLRPLLAWAMPFGLDFDRLREDGEATLAAELRAWALLSADRTLRRLFCGEGPEPEGGAAALGRRLGLGAGGAARLREALSQARRLAELDWPGRPLHAAELRRGLRPDERPARGASPAVLRRWTEGARAVMAGAALRWVHRGGERADRGLDDSFLALAAALGLG